MLCSRKVMLPYSAFSSRQALSFNAYLPFLDMNGVLMLLNKHNYSIFAIFSEAGRRNKQHDSRFSFLINGLVCSSSCDTEGKKREREEDRGGEWREDDKIWCLSDP